MPPKLVKIKVETPNVIGKRGQYTIKVEPWNAEVWEDPQDGSDSLQWRFWHRRGQDPSTEQEKEVRIVLEPGHPFSAPTPANPAMGPGTGTVNQGAAGGVHCYRIEIDLGPDGRIVLDPEYTKRP